MNLEIASSKITGHPGQDGWAQVHDFTPPSDLVKTHGRLIAVVSMGKAPVGNAQININEEIVVGRKILGRLHEEYFGKKGTSPLDTLKSAVEKTVKEFTNPNQSLNLLVASFIEDAVFIVGFGEVSSFILRQGNLAQILKSEEKKLTSGSGRFRQGDIFLLTTNNLFKTTSLGVLKAALANLKLEVLAPQIHARGNLSSLGSIVLTIQSPPQLQKLVATPNPAPKINAYEPSLGKVSRSRKVAALLIDKLIAVLPERKIFIRGEDFNPSHKKQVAVSAGIILLLLLGVSISFGIKQRSNKFAISKYEGKLIQAQHDFSEAQALSSLNPSRARELVLGAKTSVEDLNKQGIKDTRLAKLTGDISEGLGNIAGIYNVTPALYLDLSLTSSGFKADELGISEDRIAALDRDGKKLVSIEESTKRTETKVGPDIMPKALSLAVYSDRNFVVSDDGIWEVGEKAELLIKKDWDGKILVNAYTGNIYVLEIGKNIVWRFTGDGGVFGNKQNWFGQGVNPDLSNVISWSIDGSIWMLTKGGAILRFSQGSPQGFSLKEMDKPLTNASDIFTNEETNFIYILDAGNKRVVVIDKNGEYKAQYLSDQLKEAKEVVVSEADKKIIFLTGTKLYSIDIKHL